MVGWQRFSALRSALLFASTPLHAVVISVFFPGSVHGALVPQKLLQHPEWLPFVPSLWKNEGLLFADVLLQKLLLPFGLTSPYTNLFVTEAVREIAADLAAVKGGSAPRRLRGRRLQDDGEEAKATLRSFVRSLHGALGGNTFDINFADELIKHLPVNISSQIASMTEAFGEGVLRMLAEAENPASAIVMNLLAPLDGGDSPFFPFGEAEDRGRQNAATFAELQQAEQPEASDQETEKRLEQTLTESIAEAKHTTDSRSSVTEKSVGGKTTWTTTNPDVSLPPRGIPDSGADTI